VEAAQRDAMLADVLAQPHQIGDALWRIDAAGIPRRDLRGGVLVCGEESIGGDLAAAALGDRATGHVRAGTLEPWAGEDTLVLCASYSGDGEQALAGFAAAGERGCARVVVCTAGRLAAQAREQGVPVIGVPSGMTDPGAAVVYVTLAALECAALAGAGPSLRAEAEAASATLVQVDEAQAQALAAALRGRVPVICGEPAVARRWAERIEATTGAAAFWRPSAPPATDPLAPVALAEHARGDTPLARVLSLVMLGDLVAVELGAQAASGRSSSS
jgi:glucose/mannose-6-phosphate isomerase